MSRRLNFLLFLVILALSQSCASYHFSGHSFFSIRPPFQTAMPEKEALWHYDWLNGPDNGYCGTVEVVPFGGRTVGDELGMFFTPNCKCVMNIVEFKENVPSSTTDQIRNKDIEARNFNIATSSVSDVFRSKVKIHPVHSFAGVGLAYRQRINDCWWFEISAPIMQVKNKIDVCERVINDGGGVADTVGLNGIPHAGTMLEALRGRGWKFGRFDPNHEHKKIGVADVELKVGWESYVSEGASFRSFIGAVLPTGNKPNPCLLFAPVVGNNHHFGVFFGSNIDFCVWERNDHRVRHIIDVSGRYLFPNHQVRSFDPLNKQWGRYIETYINRAQAQEAFDADSADAGTFGINVFTQNVKVTPRFQTTFNTALQYSYCDQWLAEFGYNFFARQGETIEFCKFPRRAALKHVLGRGLTTLSRTIGQNFVTDRIPLDTYRAVHLGDCAVDTAAHPPAISQILYGSVGYKYNEWCYPTMFSVGGSYEFSHSNAGIQRFNIWGKVAVGF